ncbi:MAG: phytoene desaturase family protein [Candidatus Nanopelagicales bacterium]
MRTVKGPTDHVVVVGAGLAGLSAAMRLAGTGRAVTVLEREPVPGGRAGVINDQGFTFDNGPTVLTMPDLIADAFASVGEDMADWLELLPIDPLYRAWFPDGSHLDVKADPAAMSDEVERVCGPAEAAGYRDYVDFVTALYRHQMNDFIDKNFDSPLDVLTPNLAKLARLGAFRRMAPKVRQYLKDPRSQRVLSFQAMYAGMSPFNALALYCVISYMDSVAGVFAPRGGMHAVPLAMAAAAEKHGVTFRYDCTVDRVELHNSRAVAVHTTDGERIPCDVVVLNPDLPVAWRDLLGHEPLSVKRLRYSPSCALLLTGSTARFRKSVHHNIHFGRSWRGVFDELISDGKLMSDPSFLVSNPTFSDPTLAPQRQHVYYVFFPTPNLQADIDWSVQSTRYRDEMVRTLHARGYVGFDDAIVTEHFIDPRDWQARGMAGGSPFASAHTFFQTGPFRPRNIWGENVVFTGSGTTPGVGVPMVIISGRLAAERITGPDPSYRSLAYEVGA